MTKKFRSFLMSSPTPAAVALAALLVPLAACDRRSDTGKAVDKGATQITSVAGGGTGRGTEEARNTAYAGVVELVSSASTGDSPEAAAAMFMLAQAQTGQAERPAGQAAALERQAANRLIVARSLADGWLSRNAAAASAESYDPTAQIAELDAKASERQKSAAAETAKKAEIDGRIADLRTRAQAKYAEADTHQGNAAQLREQAARLSATAGLPLVEQAAQQRRQADRIRMEGATLDAEADALVPHSTGVQLEISRLTNQAADLAEIKTSLQEAVKRSREDARAAREDAAESAQDLDIIIQEITALRDGDLAARSDEAVAAFKKALASANKASAIGPSAKITAGNIQQSIGDLHWLRARGHASFAGALEALTAAQPKLPNADAYAALAQKAREGAKASQDEAKSAYEAALGLYQGAGARGEAAERIEAVKAALEQLIKGVQGESMDMGAALAAAAPTAETPTPDAPPAAAPAGGAQEAFAAFFKASVESNVVDQVALLHADESRVGILEAMQMAAPAMTHLERACQSKFNISAEEFMRVPAQAETKDAFSRAVDVMRVSTPADYQITESADAADITGPGLESPIKMIRINGAWKVDLGSIGIDAAQFEQVRPVMPAFCKAVEDMAADIEQGKHAAPDAARMAFFMKLAEAMGLQGGPGGGQ